MKRPPATPPSISSAPLPRARHTRWTTTTAAASLFVAGTALLGLASAARSDDMKEQCAQSFEDGQKSRREGKLRDARKQFVVCAADACPEIVAPACAKWLREVDEALPTIVVVARGPAGDQIGDVRVFVDHELVTSSLDGKPIAIDPGKHVLRYETNNGEPIEEEVIINVGDHNRRLEPEFHAPKPAPTTTSSAPPIDAPPTTASGPVRWPAYLTIGVGGAGLLVGAITGGLALAAKGALDDACATKTTCPATAQDDIDQLSTMSTVSTVGFIAGGVIAATGIIVVLALPKGSATKTATELFVSPVGAGVRGSF